MPSPVCPSETTALLKLLKLLKLLRFTALPVCSSETTALLKLLKLLKLLRFDPFPPLVPHQGLLTLILLKLLIFMLRHPHL